ncbi:MAG: hypothetical protein R3C70_07075 [Geminicoccaceae bacterium]
MSTNVQYFVRLTTDPSSPIDLTDDITRMSISRALANDQNNLGKGSAGLSIDDPEGIYVPERDPRMRLNGEVEIQATTANSGEFFKLDTSRLDQDPMTDFQTLFRGFIERITTYPSIEGGRRMAVSCGDRVKTLRRRTVNTTVQTDIVVSSLAALAFDVANVPVTAYSIDPISDSIPLAWYDDRDLLNVLSELIEAGGYSAYVTGEGVLRLRDRFFDIGATVTASYDQFYSLTHAITDGGTINRVKLQAEPRRIVDSLQAITSLPTAVAIEPGQALDFFVTYQDPRNQESAPAVNVATPAAGTDWTLNAADNGSGANLTGTGSLSIYAFAEAAKVSVFNGAVQLAYLTKLELRGQPVVRDSRISIETEDEASVEEFGAHDRTTLNRLWGSFDQLASRASDLISLNAQPRPAISATIRNAYPAIIETDIGDAIHITNSYAGIDDQFTVISIDHDISADGGWVHQVSYGLERSREFDTLVLNSMTRGILDTNRLGRASRIVIGDYPVVHEMGEEDLLDI